MDVDAETDTHPSGMVNGHTDTDTTKTDSDQKSKSKLRLSFEEYRSMARTIAGHLRAEEYRADDGKSLTYYKFISDQHFTSLHIMKATGINRSL